MEFAWICLPAFLNRFHGPEVPSKLLAREPERDMKFSYHILLLAFLSGPATCLINRNYRIVRKMLTWITAQKYCRTNYIDLATFQTESEFKRFLNVSSTYLVSQSWIGLYKAPTERQFTQWSDGSLVNYTYWQYGEPSNLNTSHCGSILPTDEWSSNVCTDSLYFFCYRWNPSIVVVQELKTWDEALGHCRESYKDLISLTTKLDFAAVSKSLVNQTTRVWTGLRFINRLWFWANNQSLGALFKLPSCPAQPDRCGALVPGSWVLENRDCREKWNFVCYVY